MAQILRSETCPQHGWLARGTGDCTCWSTEDERKVFQHSVGIALKQEGMDRARQAASAEWVTKANGAIDTLARSGFSFSSEDVRTIVGDPPSPGILGALFNQAAKQGRVKRVGYVKGTLPSQHARVLSQWVGA